MSQNLVQFSLLVIKKKNDARKILQEENNIFLLALLKGLRDMYVGK